MATSWTPRALGYDHRMRLDMVRLAVPASISLAFVLASAAPARAEGESCVRDTDCGGQELCLGGVCAVPETAPPTCAGGCEFDETCVDGFCKVEGVACDNPAGRCWVEQGHGLCECGAGEGAGWSDGFNPDDPPQTKTDAEMFTQCTDTLVEVCGTEAPSLPDSCVPDVLADCEAFLLLENAVAEDCGEGVPEVTIARLGECCDRYDEPDYVEFRNCLGGTDAPTCAQRSECVDGEGGGRGEGAGDTDSGGDQDGGDTDASTGIDEDTSSCSVGNGSEDWTVVGLFALLPFVGRRRRALR